MRNKQFLILQILIQTILWPQPSYAHDLDLWVPPSPSLPVSSYMIIDADTQQILASKNSERITQNTMIEPLLMLYALNRYEQDGLLHWDDPITVTTTHKTSGKKIGLKLHETVSLWDIVSSIIVFQASDAIDLLKSTIFLSKTPIFPSLQSLASQLQLSHTTLDDKISATSPQDIAVLASHLLNSSQKLLHLFQEKSYTRNSVTFYNTNTLLTTDTRIKGMYTNHSIAEGYNLLGYGTHQSKRWIIIVLGAKNKETRDLSTKILMNYAERLYKKINVEELIAIPSALKVWCGTKKQVAIQPMSNLSISMPVSLKHYNTKIKWNLPIMAPIKKGDELGTIELKSKSGKLIYSIPLTAKESIPRASFIYYYINYIYLIISSLFGATPNDLT